MDGAFYTRQNDMGKTKERFTSRMIAYRRFLVFNRSFPWGELYCPYPAIYFYAFSVMVRTSLTNDAS